MEQQESEKKNKRSTTMPKANAGSGSVFNAEFLVKSVKSLICLVLDNLQAKSKI
jgi:hypothetical protein